MTQQFPRKSATKNSSTITISLTWRLVTLTAIASLLLSLPSVADSAPQQQHDKSSVFLQQQNSSAPEGCNDRIVPTFDTKQTNDEFLLVVDVANISSKQLNVHVDFQTSVMHVLGWYDISSNDSDGPIHETANGDNQENIGLGNNTKCLFQEWNIDTTTSSNVDSSGQLDIHNLVMHRANDQVIITLPKQMPSSSKNSQKTESRLEQQVPNYERTLERPLPVENKSDTLQGKSHSNHDSSSNKYSKQMDEELALILTTDPDEEEHLIRQM